LSKVPEEACGGDGNLDLLTSNSLIQAEDLPHHVIRVVHYRPKPTVTYTYRTHVMDNRI